jgi:hypothetical protein
MMNVKNVVVMIFVNFIVSVESPHYFFPRYYIMPWVTCGNPLTLLNVEHGSLREFNSCKATFDLCGWELMDGCPQVDGPEVCFL